MRTTEVILLACLSLCLSCVQDGAKQDKLAKINTAITKQNLPKVTDTTALLNKVKEHSMVISCGSGCAMRYNVIKVTGNTTLITVEFSVEMFEDEIQTEDFVETFYFYYNEKKKLEKITRGDEAESFLETQMPNAQREFKTFADKLILEF